MKIKLYRRIALFVLLSVSFQLHSQPVNTIGTALKFDGTDDYVNCGNAGSLNITGAITIEAWINADTWNANSWGGTIVGKDNTSPAGYDLRCGNNGMLSFVIGTGGAWKEVLSGPVMSTGRWNSVAGVYDGTTMSIYINGILSGQLAVSTAIGISAQSLFIGNSPGYPTRFFDGNIDEVRIWNVARSQSQIQSDMYNTLTGTEIGLVNYWQFNNGSGITLTDVVGSSNGTLINMNAPACWVESYAMAVPVPGAATNILNTAFTANWSAPAIGTVTSYKLDVSTNNTFTSLVSGYNNLDCGSNLSKAVTGLSSSTNYYYRVRADKTSVTGTGANYYIYTTTATSVPYAGKYSGGVGTSGDPYQIATLDDLIELSDSQTDWNAGKYFIQTADIDAIYTNTMNSGAGFFPIGSFDFEFRGVYDGQNHTITNLYINRSSTDEVGLFGYITGSGSGVKNLGLINVNITGLSRVAGLVGNLAGSGTYVSNSYSTGSVIGSDYVGGLVGEFQSGTMDSSYSEADVTGSKSSGGLVGQSNSGVISNSHSTGNVVGNNQSAGGLIGFCFSTISNCYSTGNVSGSGTFLFGGLVGYNGRNISNCYSTGSVTGSVSCKYVGGLVGSNEGWEVINSYATGSVSGNEYVGGLVGLNVVPVNNCYSTGSVSGSGSHIAGLTGSNEGDGMINNSYATGSVSGSGTNIGGLSGYNGDYNEVNNCFWDTQTSGQSTSFGGTGLTTAQMKTQSIFTTAPSNWDFTSNSGLWKIQRCSYISYPYLQGFIYDTTGTIPAVNPIPGLEQVNNNYDISASVNPANSGTVAGGGTYCYGDTVALTATANSGYSFINWTESGLQVSDLASYKFASAENRTLVANFELLTSIFFNKSNLTIKIFPNPVINELTINNIDENSIISIYDLNGQLLINKTAKSITEKIDVSSLASGIYFIKIINENTINTSKLIKQ
jgi:hypothetical protein